jgi:hypothetical protein
MRFEEVVEELHVELIVLDDQNRFTHSDIPSPEGPLALFVAGLFPSPSVIANPHCRS